MEKAQKLIEALTDLCQSGNLFELAVCLLVLNLPGILAFAIQLFGTWSREKIWKARIQDKNEELERLVKTNKKLQNQLLKTQRE